MGIPLLSDGGVLTAAAAHVSLSSCPRLETGDSPGASVLFLALFAVFLALDWAITARALWVSIVKAKPDSALPFIHNFSRSSI